MPTLAARYDGEIAYMDALVGDFLRWLRDHLGADHSPLVIVAGDHGEALGELEQRPGVGGGHSRWLSEGMLHVPLVIHWEGRLPAGRVLETPIALVDVAPTLFELLGVDGFSTQGQSVAAAVLGGKAHDGADPAGEVGPAGRRSYVYSERPALPAHSKPLAGAAAQYAVQDGRYKLILSEPGRRTELYDLLADPGEGQNLTDAAPAERDRLLAALDAWLADTPAVAPSEGVAPEKFEALRSLGGL